jgi:hypothetical protein
MILRETVRRVELSADVSPNDPALADLRRILLLKIAALEAEDPKSDTGFGDIHQPPRAA